MVDIALLAAEAEVWTSDGELSFSRDMRIDIVEDAANAAHYLTFQLETAGGTFKQARLKLSRESVSRFVSDNDPKIERTEPGTGADVTAHFNVLGLQLGTQSTLSRVVVELPPAPHSQTNPFCSILFYWELRAKPEANFKTLDGTELDASVETAVEVSVGFGMIEPPGSLDSEAKGARNFIVRFGVEALGLDTGWLPLPSFGSVDFFDNLLDDIGEEGFWSDWEMPRLLRWFEDLIDTGEARLRRLPRFSWNRDFNIRPNWPLGLSFKKQFFSIRKINEDWVVTAGVEGLIATWNDLAPLEWDDFEATLTYSNGAYLFKAQFIGEHYPDNGQTEPYRFSLPFEALTLSTLCWQFRAGMISDAQGKLCFDTILSLGDLKITSALMGSETLYATDMRIHMRDLTIMTADAAAGTPMFHGLPNAPFSEYANIPALTFAKKLRNPPPKGAPNEAGLTITDGAFNSGECALLAWRQRGNQLIKALAHDILGTAPAGENPDDATEYQAAVEFAWFANGPNGRTTQIRFDWRSQKDPTAGQPIVVDTPLILPAQDVRFNGAQLGEQQYAFDVPGVSMRVAKPETHSLVYRSDEAGKDSLSYLFLWSDPATVPFLTNDAQSEAIADVRVGFALKPEDGARQVQDADTSEGRSFLHLALGRKQMGQDRIALRVVGYKSGEGSQFFRVFEGGFPSIIPDTVAAQSPDACPPRPTPRPAPVDLAFDGFSSISLRQTSPWRVMVKERATQALSKLFGDKVKFKLNSPKSDPENNDFIKIPAELAIKLSQKTEITGEIVFLFDVSDFSVRIAEDAKLGLEVPFTEETPAWAEDLPLEGGTGKYVYTKDEIELLDGLNLTGIMTKAHNPNAAPHAIFEVELTDGRFVLRVPDGADLILRNGDIGDGITFLVDEFEVGPAGIDLKAALVGTNLKLPGLKTPVLLERASLSITDGKLEQVMIKGSGRLPELLNETPFTVDATLFQDSSGRVRLKPPFEVTVGNGDGAPIFSRGTRFRFNLQSVLLKFDDDDGRAPPAWSFRMCGSVQFVPNGAEFLGGALEDLQSITMEFSDAPLSDEFFEHVNFIAVLAEPKVFSVFSLFEMEVRSIGFHPSFEPFDNTPAIIIGGQVKFGDVGDVLQAEIDFHRMYIGGPREGEVLPQFYFKGLRVEIATSGFKIAGELQHFDDPKIKGFAGSCTILVPGMPELAASCAFTKIRASEEDSFKRAWFIAVEASKMSIQIAPLPLYLRQAGMGFGYRYTSVIIKRFEEEVRLGPLIALMKKEINNHQTLADMDTWAPDAERDGQRGRWSVGLEAVMSMASANTDPFTYHAEKERQLRSVVAQMLIFLRSDLTFLAAAKVWFPVSADEFFENDYGMRQRPLALGFMMYSAPQKRLLIHAAKGKNPYMGPKDNPVPEQVKEVLNKSHFEATFLSDPGLIHAELGWPDRLFFPFDVGPLKLECRGGVLFRVERGVLVQGIYFSAIGRTDLEGSLSIGIVGVRVSAKVTVSVAIRLMIGIQLSKPLQSTIYAVVGVAVSVQFRIYAWFRLNLRFCKISIDLYFSLDLQITLAMELGWAGGSDLGFRAQATLMISVFGRGLSVKASVSANAGGVNRARRRMEPYMRSYLEPGAIPPIPGLTVDATPQTEALRTAKEARRTAAAVGLSPPEIDTYLTERNLAPTPNSDLDFLDYALAHAPSPAVPGEADFMQGGALEVVEREDYDLALAMARGTARQGEKRLWIGWVVPSPETPAYYPVPTTEGEAVAYATLDVPHDPNAAMFAPKYSNCAWVWTQHMTADGRDRLPLNIRSAAGAVLEAEDGTVLTDVSLSLQQQLAACHIPTEVSDFKTQAGIFPENYAPGMPLSAPHKAEVETVEDDRLNVPGSEAENPRRQLQRGHHLFDDYMLDAAGETDIEDDGDAFAADGTVSQQKLQLQDQAQGSQSYLSRVFADDLQRLADTVKIDQAGRIQTPDWPTDMGRPSLLDLGLVVCVVAEKCPDWLNNPTAASPANLSFENIEPIQGTPSRYFVSSNSPGPDVHPVVDFEKIDFELSPPNLTRQTRHYFDDVSLHFGWDITWGALGRPRDKNGSEADLDLEDFVAGYDVVVIQVGENGARDDAIDRVVVAPADLRVGKESGSGAVRLKGTYQYNRQLSNLGLDVSRFLSTSVELVALITPISQDGTRSRRPFRINASYRPSARPLPPDNVRLEVTRQTAEPGDETVPLIAALKWRELALPNSALVAPTARWDLILRPLATLPPGAYPAEASDPDDPALMSAEAPTPKDGDLVVVLQDPDPIEPEEGDGRSDDEDLADRDPAEAVYLVEFPSRNSPGGAVLPGVFDHTGKRLPPADPRAIRAMGFVKGTPATDPNGAGWHIFMRAASDALPKAGEDLQANAVSAMVRVQMSLTRPDAGAEGAGVRPLPHLEWAALPEAIAQIETQQMGYVEGPIHVAAVSDDGDRFDYLPLPGSARGVSLQWSASTPGIPVSHVASYTLHETRLDGLLNADVAEPVDNIPPGFGAKWDVLREIQPVLPNEAARSIVDFAQPELWEGLPPQSATAIRWLAEGKVDQAEMERLWPAGYSWAESDLLWVPHHRAPAQHLAEISDLIDLPPQEVPNYPKAEKPVTPADKRAFLASLASRHTLGGYYAKRKLHPWMQVLIGTLARRGQTTPDLTDARFEVEISPPKAPSSESSEGPRNPLEWMQADSPRLDPMGWGALGQLGLSVAISLRDPWTGNYLVQSQVEAELRAAILQTSRDMAFADRAFEDTFDFTVQNLDGTTSSASFGGYSDEEALDIDPAHFSLDMPIQATWAEQAGSGSLGRDDARVLSMLQFSLRPIPAPMKPQPHKGIAELSPGQAHYALIKIHSLSDTPDGQDPKTLADIAVAETTTLAEILRPAQDLPSQIDEWEFDAINLGPNGDLNETWRASGAGATALDALMRPGDWILMRHRMRAGSPHAYTATSAHRSSLLKTLLGGVYEAGAGVGALERAGIKFAYDVDAATRPLPLLEPSDFVLVQMQGGAPGAHKLSDIVVGTRPDLEFPDRLLDVTLAEVLHDKGDIDTSAWALDGFNLGHKLLELTPLRGDRAKPDLTLRTLWRNGDWLLLRTRAHKSSDITYKNGSLFRALFGDETTPVPTPGVLADLQFTFDIDPNPQERALPVEIGKRPVDLATKLAPWKRFAADINWGQYYFAPNRVVNPGDANFVVTDPTTNTETLHPHLGRFVDHLTDMLAGWGAEDGKTEEIRKGAIAQDVAGEFISTYLAWSERFFTSGPSSPRIDDFSEVPAWTGFVGDQIATAWPQRAAPLRMAPDARGLMQATHRIMEDWASRRSYAVTRRHRWHDFFTPEAPAPAPVLSSQEGRVEVPIPRRREINAAPLIGLRSILSDQGQPFHEITLATPVDLVLSKANSALAPKIEFQALVRQFRMAFRHAQWVDWLDMQDAVGFPEGDLSDEFIDITPDVDLKDSAGDYLASAPRARLDSIRIQSPAEPHYFEQEMLHYTAATHVHSKLQRVLLPAPKPSAPVAWGDDSPVIDSGEESLNWSDIDKADWDAQADAFAAVLSETPPTEKAILESALRPYAFKSQVRMPWLMESLPAESLKGYAALEASAGSYGFVPDPAARIEIVENADDVRVTLASVTPNSPNFGGEKKENSQVDWVPLVTQKASENHFVDVKKLAGPVTPESGLRFTVTTALKLEVAKALGPAGAALFDLPENVSPPGDFDLMGQIPDLPAFRQVLPLALRLGSRSSAAGVVDVISLGAPLVVRPEAQDRQASAAPRWMARPSLPALPDVRNPMAVDDLALGIRLLVDLERRRAAAAVAQALENAADDDLRDIARLVLGEIETGRAAMLSKTVGDLDSDDVSKVLGMSGQDFIITYAVRPLDVMVVTNPEDLEDDHRIIAVVQTGASDGASDDTLAAFAAVAIASHFSPNKDAFDAVSETARDLAKVGYVTKAASGPTMFVHRGNIAPVPWGAPKEAAE